MVTAQADAELAQRAVHGNYLFDHGDQDRFIVRLIVGAEPFNGPTG
ncbi:hypothetical protein ACWD0J_40765 [Streptomyces sp. NPDC003011]